MDPVAAIAMWSSLFVATHFLISSQALRPRLINLIGGERYRRLYSLLAIAILAPMMIVFARHKHAGPMLGTCVILHRRGYSHGY